MDLQYEYMVEMQLPLPINNSFISLIPAQRTLVNRLLTEKIITSYAVSLEEGKLWISLIACSIEEVESILQSFPIIDHVDCRISKLVFNNSKGNALLQFSLN